MPKNSLRVLALMTDAFGGHGGIAQYNRDFLSSLACCEQVAEVMVLPRAGKALAAMLPSGIRQFSPVRGRFAYSLAALWAMRRHSPIDVVFCGHIFMAPLAVIIARRLGARLWVQVHGVDAWEELSSPYRRAVEAADLITSVSRYTRQRLLEWIGIDPARVRILPNTVEPQFRPGPKPTFLLDRHGAYGKNVIITVARLAQVDRYKGQDRIIRILPRVLADHPDITYLVVGDGDDRSRLEALALECGVRENVIFAGPVPPEELPDYYRLADALVMPSTGEGFGIVFLEAMASGIPVVGGNKDGSLDPLLDGLAGIAVDPEDGPALSAAICATLRCPAVLADAPERFSKRAFSLHVRDLVASFATKR